MSERDENDLTNEQLLAMWEEGEPVEIVMTKLEPDALRWVHAVQSAARGVVPPDSTKRLPSSGGPRGPRIEESDLEEAVRRTA